MKNWAYVASDARACIRDTRALALSQGLIWYPSRPFKDTSPGDRLLFCYRTGPGVMTCLGVFELMDATARTKDALDTPIEKVPVFGEDVWDSVWDHFREATKGRDGAGYAANARRRVMCVKTLDPLEANWAGVEGAHAHPEGAEVVLPEIDQPEVMRELKPRQQLVLGGPLAELLKSRLH